MTTTFATGTTGAERYNSRMTPKEGELPRDWHPILDELHAALTAKMEAEGLSGRAVAAATGIAHGSMSLFLRKERGLAWNTASALASYLERSIKLTDPPKKRPAK